MKLRNIWIGILLVAFSAVFAGCGGARTVIADTVNGTVQVTTGETKASLVKGEQLVSGQSVSVQAASDLTLLMDSDKHAYAGEGTEFSLEATGGKNKTRTRFDVKTGKLKFIIENKLGAKESFEVETPNAVMSVRGTVFTVEVVFENGRAVTYLTVESGLVEAVTEEGGVERTVSAGPGQSEIFNGKAPGKKDDDKAAAPKKTSRGSDGPKVRVLYTDDKGEAQDEYINFSEDFEGFEGKLYKGTWTMDLLGERIELLSVMTLNTDVVFRNGTFVTDASNYIYNKGIATFGEEAYTYTDTHIETDGLAIENEGTLMLRGVDFRVLSGTAVRNTGNLSYQGYQSRQYEPDMETDVTLDSGLFLYNAGFAYLNGVAIAGKTENYIVNDKHLAINHSALFGEGETFVVNHDGATANLGDCFFVTESETSVAFLNEGFIEHYMSSEAEDPGFVWDAYGNPYFAVKAGTGLVNKNTVNALLQCLVLGGTGIDNYADLNAETYTVRMELDGGLGLLNEENGRVGSLEVFVKSGTAVKNFGSMGVNNQYLTAGVIDDYTGVLITNEKSGIINGGATIQCGALSDGVLLHNKGTVKDAILKLTGGGKNSSEYYKFPEISELKLYMGATLLSPYFTYIDTGALMKNAILFKDEGVTENTSLSLCLSGKGSGTYEGYHAMGSGKHEFSNGTVTLYCANGTGLVIDKGIECKLGGYTTQTGLQSGVDMYGLSSLYYVEDPDSFDFSFFTGNTAVLNNGTIKDSTVTAYMKGTKSTGIQNEGFTENVNLITTVSGDRNTGIINNGTLKGGRIDAGIDKIGGNVGVFNDKVIEDMNITCNGGNRITLSVQTEKSSYGEDIVFLNSKNGTVDCYDSVLNIGVECPVLTAFANRNYVRIGSTYIRVYMGTGILCDEGSTFRTFGLSMTAGDDTNDQLCNGTGMMIHGIAELTGREGATEAGRNLDGGLSVYTNSPNLYGIYVASGGSFSQVGATAYKLQATSITSKYNGHSIVNYGHLVLEYPRLTKFKSTWERCISDSGIFSFTPFKFGIGPDCDFTDYPDGCPGPWYGMEYTDGDKIW